MGTNLSPSMLLRMLGLQVLALISAVFSVLGAYQIVRAFSARKWPKVLGTIEETNVMRTGRGGDLKFAESVRYRYEVDGTSYTSDRMQFGLYSSPMESFPKKSPVDRATRAAAENLANEYRVQSAIVVYYNPHRPNESTLDASVDAHTWALTFGGAVFVAVVMFLP